MDVCKVRNSSREFAHRRRPNTASWFIVLSEASAIGFSRCGRPPWSRYPAPRLTRSAELGVLGMPTGRLSRRRIAMSCSLSVLL